MNYLLDTEEEWLRVAEDYFELIPPDIDFFKIELCIKYEVNHFEKELIFYFDDLFKLEEFLDKVKDCPLYEATFNIEFDGVDYDNLTITIKAGEGVGLYG